MKIAVVTPSIPARAQELSRAILSVNQQSLPPDEHLIGIDYNFIGPALIRNQLITATTCDWIAFLDDDDRLYPNHLEVLSAFTDQADVIVPHCDFDGPPLPSKYYNQLYDRERLRKHGCFPVTVLARKEAMLTAGLFQATDRYEDHQLWNRMADNKARFHVVPTITWTYRTLHPDRRTKGVYV